MEIRDMTKSRKALLAAALAAGFTVGAAAPVFAGEVTGSGRGGPNGNGIPGATTVRGTSIRASPMAVKVSLPDPATPRTGARSPRRCAM
jgi:hypothetical protein